MELTYRNLCPKCFSFIGNDDISMKTYKCRKCGTVLLDKAKPFQVDLWVAKAIQRLNRKGYKTFACCEGHLNSSSPYVCFDEDYYNILEKTITNAREIRHIMIDKNWKSHDGDPRLMVCNCGNKYGLKAHYKFCKELKKLSKILPRRK